MRYYNNWIGALFLIATMQSCASIKKITSESEVTGSIEQVGLFNGFPKGTTNADGTLAYCESSAVIHAGNRLIIASDKAAPNDEVSSVFSIPLSSTYPNTIKEVDYITSTNLNTSSKIESFAKSPLTDIYFAATAFDRIKPDSPEWDTYNRLIYWTGTQTADARVLFRTEDQGVISSKSIREALHRVIRNRKYPGGVSYYKIEGLAVLKDNRILFGVRELGPSYQDFDYSFTIVTTTFIQSSSGIVINPDWGKVFEFDPSKDSRINKPLGLSSLEYHEATNSIIALTTYESEAEAFESYIWMLPLDKRLSNRTKPVLVLDAAGKPLKIPHKAEGLAPLDKNTLFIVCDEDRALSKIQSRDGGELIREPHQGVYAIVKIKN